MNRYGFFYTAIVISSALHIGIVLMLSKPYHSTPTPLTPVVQLIKLEISPMKPAKIAAKPPENLNPIPVAQQNKLEIIKKITENIKNSPKTIKKTLKVATNKSLPVIKNKIVPTPPKNEIIPESTPLALNKTPQKMPAQLDEMASQSNQTINNHQAMIEQQYLDQLIAHIDHYKQYPRLAQKRHLQGQVRVRFSLLAENKIEDLEVKQNGLLAKASIKAVKQALPMPNIPAEISLPLELDFVMEYRLR